MGVAGYAGGYVVGDPSVTEFEALARLAAGVLDAPSATITALDEHATRLGASGVSWASDEEAPFLRWVASAEGTNANPLSTFDLTQPTAEPLHAAGLRGAVVVPLREGRLLGVLAIYTTTAPSPATRRRLLDLGAIATQLLVARRGALLRAAGERQARMAASLGDLLRGEPDERTGLRLARETLGVARVVLWKVDGAALIASASYDRDRQSNAVEFRATPVPALLRALGEREVIPASEARVDPRTSELAASYLVPHAIASLMIAPIFHAGRVAAALAFEHDEVRRWTIDEIRFAAAVAGWLALARTDDAVSSQSTNTDRRLVELVATTEDRIAITDVEGRFVYANPSMGRALGTDPRDLVGRSAAEFSPPHLKDLPGLRRFRETGDLTTSSSTIIREIVAPGRGSMTWEISGTPFETGGTTYVGYVARDVTAATARLDATMTHISLAIAHVALDGQFLRFNDQFRALVGRDAATLRAYRVAIDLSPPPDARGVSVIDALGLESRGIDLAAIRAQLVTSNEAYELEHELVRPDGTTVWIELSIALVRDASLRASYFVVVARDVTARHHTDRALRGLADTLAVTGSALVARACAFLGSTLGARCVLVGRFRGAVVEPLAAWLDGEPFAAPNYPLQGTPCEGVMRGEICYHPDHLQTQFPDDPMLRELGVDSYMGAPIRDATGLAVGVVAVLGEHAFDPDLPSADLVQLCATRISSELQRIEATELLATREEQLRQITEGAQETFWLATWPPQSLIYVSRGFELLTGRSLASVYSQGEGLGTSLHPEDRAGVDELMLHVDAVPVDRSARVVRTDGRMRWVQVRASIVRDHDGKPYRIAGSFEDITQIKETQQALEERERQLADALALTEREVEQLQVRLGEHDELHGMVGSSQLLRGVYRRLRQVSQSDVTVLIAGESGTGKELAANALHALSARKSKPFVAINCAAIPEALLESELFGHVKGAFTGAGRDKIGLMQAAEGGTLFLDEIGDMSPILQVKVLRALQERVIRRVGDEKVIPVDIRIISASHRDLKSLVTSGKMREDFYYRIKVFEIEMPALRERCEDIPVLANHFVHELGRAAGKPKLTISVDAMRALVNHRWPGNVRELRNAIEHALVTVTGATIQVNDLPLEVRSGALGIFEAASHAAPVAAAPMPAPTPAPTATLSPSDLREQIEQALLRSGGNRAEAARLLGIGRVTLWKRMRRLGMTTDGDEA